MSSQGVIVRRCLITIQLRSHELRHCYCTILQGQGIGAAEGGCQFPSSQHRQCLYGLRGNLVEAISASKRRAQSARSQVLSVVQQGSPIVSNYTGSLLLRLFGCQWLRNLRGDGGNIRYLRSSSAARVAVLGSTQNSHSSGRTKQFSGTILQAHP